MADGEGIFAWKARLFRVIRGFGRVFEKTIYARLGLWHISRLPFFPETKFPEGFYG